jgi:hypothetical protein
VRRLLEADALAVFEQKVSTLGAETANNCTTGLDAVAALIFPQQAMLLQKRYMRWYLRKPAGMSTRDYVARLNEINAYLPSFPPAIAGGREPEALAEDELKDLLEFGVPNSWQRAMILQDFDPLQHTVAEFVQFCERLEQVELADGTSPASKSGSASSPKEEADSNKESGKRKPGRGKDKAKSSGTKSKKSCLLHGEDCGHSTNKCRTLGAQAKRMKATYDAQAPEKKKAYKQQQELHNIIMEIVNKQLNEKKRKPKDERVEELNEFENISLSDSSADSS